MVKKHLYILALLVMVLSSCAKGPRLCGSSISSWRIIYPATAEEEVGSNQANMLKEAILKTTGIPLEIATDETLASSHEILIGETNREALQAIDSVSLFPFKYKIQTSRRNITIKGGGSWALSKACENVIEKLSEGLIKKNDVFEGTVEGEFLFNREKDVNLRILDDNIWQFDSKESTIEWKEAGLECTNAVRGPQFVQLVRAYMPDVAAFQEVSNPMKAVWDPLLAKYNYKEAFNVPKDGVNFTPIYINTETVELLDAGYVPFVPEKWNNSKTKSYSWAVCHLKEKGQVFIVVSTHLWYKSDQAEPGSSNARAEQVKTIMQTVEKLKNKYDCPVIVVGDMNAVNDSQAMKNFYEGGYLPCETLATNITDMTNGHHLCKPHDPPSRAGLNRTRNEAIDHLLLYNGKDVEIRNFICEKSMFTIMITDHCPNILDIVLPKQ